MIFNKLIKNKEKKEENDCIDFINMFLHNKLDKNYFNKNNKYWFNFNEWNILNSGNYTLDDIKEFKNYGTGNLVIEKDVKKVNLFKELILWENEDSNRKLIRIYYKHFPKFNGKLIKYHNNNLNRYVFLENANTYENYSKDQIINNAFHFHYLDIIDSFGYLNFIKIRKMWNEISFGVSKTLSDMGLGYFGAINTPEEIYNLSWNREILFFKAYYIYLKKNGYTDPLDNWFDYINNPIKFKRKEKINKINQL